MFFRLLCASDAPTYGNLDSNADAIPAEAIGLARRPLSPSRVYASNRIFGAGHRGFASSNKSAYPPKYQQYEDFVPMRKEIISAISHVQGFVGFEGDPATPSQREIYQPVKADIEQIRETIVKQLAGANIGEALMERVGFEIFSRDRHWRHLEECLTHLDAFLTYASGRRQVYLRDDESFEPGEDITLFESAQQLRYAVMALDKMSILSR